MAVLDPKSSGKLGFYALTYYFCTTILAAVLGIILVQLIRPGERGNKSQVREELLGDDPKADQVTTLDAIFDLFRYEKSKQTFQFIQKRFSSLVICSPKISFKPHLNKLKQHEVIIRIS